MSTSFFPISTASDYAGSLGSLGGTPTRKFLKLTRGPGVTSVSDVSGFAGPWGDPTTGTTYLLFISNPIDAVTISGSVSYNIRALETNAMANASVTALVSRVSADGSTSQQVINLVDATEVGTTETVRTGSGTPTSTAFSAGDRIAIQLGWTSAGGSAATGFTLTGFYSATAGGATGDTFITFTEAITEQVLATNPPYVDRQIPSLLAQ